MTDKSKPHCESCGEQNPRLDDGYTTCCNELVCTGPSTSRYSFGTGVYTWKATDGTEVDACCGHFADVEFTKLGKGRLDYWRKR